MTTEQKIIRAKVGHKMPTTLPPRELSLGQIILWRLAIVRWRYGLVNILTRLTMPLIPYRSLRYPVRWLVNLTPRIMPRR